jgi:hypothetical protein
MSPDYANGPDEVAASRSLAQRERTPMDITNSTAPEPPPSTDESSHACTDGFVYLGHLVEDPGTGEEVEVYEAVPCHRCAEVAR